MAARGRMRYWHWFRSTDIDDSDVRHYLAVNPTIIQENNLLGKLEDTNILLEQDEKGTCIFEEICLHIEASNQDQRDYKE